LERLLSKQVDEAIEKKYWRFRADRWYGGIATADCVGCGLACKFCWVNEKVLCNPRTTGSFYSPRDVASRLKTIASQRDHSQARVSGGEPTISRAHLIQLLKHLDRSSLTFILETNGILIGHDRRFAEELAQFDFLQVRVSLKGCCEDDFEKLTGASRAGFNLQLQALRHLIDEGIRCHAAVMKSFSSNESLQGLIDRLSGIDPQLSELEIEEVIMYPRIANKISRLGLHPRVSHEPSKVPAYLV